MPPTIHDIVGCLAISAWTNACLDGIESCYVLSYFAKYKNDDLWIKALVSAAWVNDTLATIINCRSVYRFTVTGFGNVAGLTEPGTGLLIVTGSLGFSVFFAQMYLIWRYFAISKDRYISAFLALAALAGLGYCFFCLKKLQGVKNLADFQSISVYVKAFVGLEAGTDLLIAIALIYVLFRHYRESSIAGTRSILFRLMWLSLESGLVTTAVAIAVLVTFVAAPHTNAGLATADNMGRVYTLTLLYNLHVRKSSLKDTEENAKGSSHSFPLNSMSNRSTIPAQSLSVLDQSIPVSLEQGQRSSFSGSQEKGGMV